MMIGCWRVAISAKAFETPNRPKPPQPQIFAEHPVMPTEFVLSERANLKGVEKAACGETVVQKGVLESPFLLCPSKVCP